MQLTGTILLLQQRPNLFRSVLSARRLQTTDHGVLYNAIVQDSVDRPVAALHQGAPGQITWLEDPTLWLRPAYCFFSVIVWSENKNVTTSNRFIWHSQRRWRTVFLRGRLKKVVNFFEVKKCIRWPGLRIFWPRNDLAPILRWRLHLMTCTCLTTLVTWKWPGCFDVLAPPLGQTNCMSKAKPLGV